MTPDQADQTDLARRLVASPHWRWVEGMLVTLDTSHREYRIIWADGAEFGGVEDGACWPKSWGVEAFDSMEPMTTGGGWIPVLTDPATIGIIEHLAREAWGKDRLELTSAHLGWAGFVTPHQEVSASRITARVPCRGSAWAEALLATPKVSS